MLKKICTTLALTLITSQSVLAASTTAWPAGAQQFPQSITRSSGITVELTPVASRLLAPDTEPAAVHSASQSSRASSFDFTALFASPYLLAALGSLIALIAILSLRHFLRSELAIQHQATSSLLGR